MAHNLPYTHDSLRRLNLLQEAGLILANQVGSYRFAGTRLRGTLTRGRTNWADREEIRDFVRGSTHFSSDA